MEWKLHHMDVKTTFLNGIIEKQVVHIQDQNQRLIIHNLVVKIRICITLGESQVYQVFIYLSIPSTGCLLESI